MNVSIISVIIITYGSVPLVVSGSDKMVGDKLQSN